jgi:hypothetical protein
MASPSASTIKSEPLMTLGWSPKSGVEFTNPTSLTPQTFDIAAGLWWWASKCAGFGRDGAVFGSHVSPTPDEPIRVGGDLADTNSGYPSDPRHVIGSRGVG